MEALATAKVHHCGTVTAGVDLDVLQTNSIQNDHNSSSAVS